VEKKSRRFSCELRENAAQEKVAAAREWDARKFRVGARHAVPLHG